MKPTLLKSLFVAALAIASTACTKHLITDAEIRNDIHEKVLQRQSRFTHGDIFAIFDKDLSLQEREAMEFLYASMPSADMGDYEGEYFLANVRSSLKARNEMAWGDDVPEDIFRHFVLPVRVNNERLDDFRMIYYDTLKMRVDGLSLHDAALEVNHWCHEKATYIPSDARTSSPMATILTGEGRCGEESTLTVSALRAVGIPARQVYTPRWAHTDSNHAWVEVWIDGKWYFMGACEPEPELNIAWFNQPATRALLMHTRVRGDYSGPEDVIQRTNCFTEINVIDNYAPTRHSTVTVVDTEQKPVAGATVEFKIFNYGEFNSVVQLATNAEGKASIHMGLGDMLVWASHEGRFGFSKLSGEQVTVELRYKDGDSLSFAEDITPPVTGDIPIKLTDEQIAENKRRLAIEDSIRLSYISTFMTAERCAEYTPQEQKILIASRGNWRNIKAFIDSKNGAERARALALLNNISGKDLHDTSLEVLNDALESTPTAELTPTYCQYILSPRIAHEFLQPYRNQIRDVLSHDISGNPSAAQIISWCNDKIELCDDDNPINLQATPAGVLRLRAADSNSRDRFFVAACRTFGIAARLNPQDQRPEYLHDDEWIKVTYGNAVSEKATAKGLLTITYDAKKVPTISHPAYSSHYTISRIENGRCQTLNFDTNLSADMGNSTANLFAEKIELDEGFYMLTSGNRMASGKILSHNVSFRIEKNKECKIELIIRSANDDIGVIGSMDAEKLYLPEGESSERSLLSTTGRGYFLLAVMGTTDQPTNHAMRGLNSISGELKAWGRPIIVLNSSAEDAKKLNRNIITSLGVSYGVDANGKVKQMLCEGCNSTSKTLPVIAICDTFGRIVYFSQGYNTSVGEQLKGVIHKLE